MFLVQIFQCLVSGGNSLNPNDKTMVHEVNLPEKPVKKLSVLSFL